MNYQGTVGWTAAGANGEPWLEKVGGSSGGENDEDNSDLGQLQYLGYCHYTGFGAYNAWFFRDPGYFFDLVMPNAPSALLEQFANWVGFVGNLQKFQDSPPRELRTEFYYSREYDSYFVKYFTPAEEESVKWYSIRRSVAISGICTHAG